MNAKKMMVGVLACSVLSATAAEWGVYDWVGGSSDRWNDAANWRKGGQPLAEGEKPHGWGSQAYVRITEDTTIRIDAFSYVNNLFLQSSTPCTLTLVGTTDLPIDINMAGGALPTISVSPGCTIKFVNCNVRYNNTTDHAYQVTGGGTVVFDTPQSTLFTPDLLPVLVAKGTVKVAGTEYVPLVRYEFEDAGNIGKDTGTLGKDLTAYNVTQADDGRRGKCAKFFWGHLYNASAAGLPCGKSSFTVSVWVKNVSLSNWRHDLYGWGKNAAGKMNCAFFQDATSKAFHHSFYGNDMNATSSFYDTIKEGQGWHHLCLTSDYGGKRTIYLDGEPFFSVDNTQVQSVASESYFVIGGHNNDAGTPHQSVSKPDTPFVGYMDDFMVLGTALTAEEVQALYTSETGDISVTHANAPWLPEFDLAADGHLEIECGTSKTYSIAGKGKVTIAAGATLVPAEVGAGALDRLYGDGTLRLSASAAINRGGYRGSSTFSGTIEQTAGTLSLAGQRLKVDDPRLIAYWKFDDPTDYGKDSGPNGMTLKPNQAGDTWATLMAEFGNAKYLSGNHGLSLVDTSKVSLLPKSGSADFTFAAWVKPTIGSAWDGGEFFRWGDPTANWYAGTAHFAFGLIWNTYVSGGTPEWALGFPGNGEARFYIGSTKEESAAAWTDATLCGGWHHVAVACAASETKFYFDGVLVHTQAKGSSTYHYDNPVDLIVGECGGGFDEGMLFSAALSDVEVASLMYGLAEGELSLKQGAGLTTEIASGHVSLTDSALPGAVTGDGALELSGDVEIAADSRIAPAAVALAENLSVTCTGAPAATAPISSTAAIALPEAMTVTFDAAVDPWAYPLFASTAGLTGSAAGWTSVVKVDGKVRERWAVDFVQTATALTANIHRPGMLLIFR